MKTELVDVSPTRKEIKIELEPEIVRQTFDTVSDRYAKQASVPGFRKGHAPRSVVRTRFKSEIRGDVLRELIPEAVNNALEKHELSAIGEPDVHLENSESLEQIGDAPISFHVGVEVFPKVELGSYKGLEATRRIRPITDDDVTQMLDQLREASAALQPVEDRGAELGDTVTVSFHGTFLDQPEGAEPAEDINVADVDVNLGGPGVQQEFTDNLLGVSADAEKTFSVDYPEDFTSKGLAGKKVEYQAKVSAVRRKELPEIDDEWARSLGEEFESVQTLRTKIREDLERRAAADADHHLRSEVMRQLLAAHQFEVPQSFVDQQTNFRMENVVREMIGRGIDPRSQELNWEGAREELKGQAEDDVRGSMLLEHIADAEQIKVSDEEIAAEIETIAQASRQPIEQVRATLTKDGGERSIAHRLRNRKALDLLIENAKVTDEEWQEETAQESENRTQASEVGK
ncbi:MAG TPA: trigger factor [Pyrinomonadaceae bacterium]|nr:trigger factor [Pyrinomonadaceae bacterium]